MSYDIPYMQNLKRNEAEEMATYSSILAWEIPWIEVPTGVTKSGTRLSE